MEIDRTEDKGKVAKCDRCGSTIEPNKLKLISKGRFSEIGQDQDDNELCDKCFKQHEREVKDYMKSNPRFYGGLDG